MIEEAVSRFSTPESLRNTYQQLPPSEKLRCALIYLSGDAGLSFNLNEPFKEPLVLTFLVFPAKNQDGEVHLFGFDEFEGCLRTDFVQTILDAGCRMPVENLSPVYLYRNLNDITTVAGLGSQGVLVKKKSGGVNRSATLQIKKITEIFVPAISENSEFVLSMVLSFLMQQGILTESDTQYLTNDAELESWLTETQSSRFQEALNFFFDYSGGWRRALLDQILSERPGYWISASVFPEIDRKNVLDTLRALRFAGVIELTQVGNEILFCKTEYSHVSTDQNVVILPDFSVVIPQEVESSQINSFLQIGIIQSLDRVYKGKIDKTIIVNSLSNGLDQSRILEWLTRWQCPANVLETVREWIREFARLYVTDSAVLISSNENVTTQINSFEPLRSLLEAVSVHSLYRIKPGCEDRVKEILSNLGFDYRMPLRVEVQSSDFDWLTKESVSEEQWSPLTETETAVSETPVAMRGTKYGSELKTLELSETLHVIDYSMLTGQQLIIEYEGSPYIKPGIYTIVPVNCQKGIDPAVEGEITRTKSKKMFYIKKIKKIGVAQK